MSYTRTAIRLSNEVPGSDEADAARAREERIERRLWSRAGEALDMAPTASVPRLYVETLNEMFDDETARIATLEQPRPGLLSWCSSWSAPHSLSGCLRRI